MLPHEASWPLPATVPSLSILLARGPPPDAEQIEKDLHRVGRLELGITDADAKSHRASLRCLLHGWCWCCEGYSQAMSHVGASLVATSSDVEGAFVSFAWLMRSLPADFFDEGHRIEARALRVLAALR